MYDPDRHHRRSIRLPAYDYAGPGTYFVTLCTHDRSHLFGEIVRGLMVRNPTGDIVWDEWCRSADIRRELTLDEAIVMPNHFHGIVILHGDPTAPPPAPPPDPSAPNPPPLRRAPRSLGSFVAGFKSATTRRIRDLHGADIPIWQRGYHEHVIRNERALCYIRNYVWTNPVRWEVDRENPNRWTDDPFDAWLDTFAAPTPPRPR